ncbi:copper amine oxidase N-terminal domain-containing protein [Paenibacillus sp. chi10]|uniref:Copper amine oxidase N-terminal domain-containing protein n=1 Tax=Paenibacillus suaedae TaxID=3077233 RepID=A0AAJ2JTS5_9BACL|nr:copper amine oxidase N-terminal domain-containing protein [Paenibacillus sp. chi10]MDT8975711.1 copper amine oxidase N-terminal domain-containing protein [Paenibacillus sp. chi10]
MKKTTIATTVALALGLMGAQAYAAPATQPVDTKAVATNMEVKDLGTNFYDKYVKQFVYNENGDIVGIKLSASLDTTWVHNVGAQESVTINGKKASGQVMVDGNHILVPFRAVTEGLGYKLTWNQAEKSSTAVKGDKMVTAILNKDEYRQAENILHLGKAALLKEQTLYVPLQFVSNVLHAGVTIDANGHIEIEKDQDPQDSFDGMHWVIVVNGEGLGVDKKDVYTTEHNVMVPVEEIGKALGYKVEKNEKTGAYEFSRAAKWIALKEGDTKASVGKMLVELKEAAAVKNGKLYMPVDSLGDVFGVKFGIDPTGVIGISEGTEGKEDPNQIPQDSFGGMHWVLVVNGEGLGEISKEVFTTEHNVMVPIEEIGKALGYKVEKNEKTGAYEFMRGARWIALKEGDKRASVARMFVELKEAPIVKNGKLFMPLDSMQDVFGAKFGVDPTGVVGISDKE